MRYNVSLCAALVALAALVSPSQAQSNLNLRVGTIGPVSDLKDRTLYLVRITCRLTRDISPIITWSPIYLKRVTVSHFVVVALTQPTASTGEKATTMPDSPLANIPAYSIRGSVKEDTLKGCDQTLLVNGNQPVYLIASQSHAKDYEPALFLKLLYRIPEVIPPLWGLLTNDKMSAHVTEKLTKIEPIKQPISDFLKEFNTNDHYTQTLHLKQGTQVVDTDYSRILIRVTPARSVIKEGYQAQLRKVIDSGERKLEGKEVINTCEGIATDLLGTGFTESVDIPYALAYFATKSNMSRENIFDCLSESYAVSAAAIGDPLWKYVIPNRRITVKQALDRFPPGGTPLPEQPSWSRIEAAIDDMVRYFSRLSKSGSLSSVDVAELNKITDPKIVIIDKTMDGSLAGGTDGDGVQTGNFLISKGIQRFGCYKETNTGRSRDGATVTLVAFKAGKTDTKTSIDKAVALRPIFEQGKVKKIYIYDNQQWIGEVLTAFNNTCYGLTVERPAGNTVAIVNPPRN